MTELTDTGSATQVHAATMIAWAEGATVDKDGTVYFSVVRGNRIMRLATDGGLSVFRSPANNPNGMIIDQLGRLIV